MPFDEHIDYKKLTKRQEYYADQAKTAIKMLKKRTISPHGLAVPTLQIENACIKFEERITTLCDRAYEVGYDLGIKDAIEELGKVGIDAKYIKTPEGNRPPDQDFFDQRSKLHDEIEESKLMFQSQPGEKENTSTLQAVTLGTVSLWSNESYTRAYLRTFGEFLGWLKSAKFVLEAKDL